MNNLVHTALTAITFLLLCGCGQMGALYIPVDESAPTPPESTATEDVTGANDLPEESNGSAPDDGDT